MIDTTCKKCPEIAGSSWCDFHKKGVWKEDEMCEHGYRARIDKGVEMMYTGECDVNKVNEQTKELENEYVKRFVNV